MPVTRARGDGRRFGIENGICIMSCITFVRFLFMATAKSTKYASRAAVDVLTTFLSSSLLGEKPGKEHTHNG